MTTNPPGYNIRRRMEIRTELVFIATNGTMRSEVSGKPVIICNDRDKSGDCATYHHRLRLNGRRPNGTNARLAEIRDNLWNIQIMTIEEHKELHRNEKT